VGAKEGVCSKSYLGRHIMYDERLDGFMITPILQERVVQGTRWKRKTGISAMKESSKAFGDTVYFLPSGLLRIILVPMDKASKAPPFHPLSFQFYYHCRDTLRDTALDEYWYCVF
jgi:hypothetical protein